jgi:hypothetical protein
VKQRNARLAWLLVLAAVLVFLFFLPWWTVRGLASAPDPCVAPGLKWPPDGPPNPVFGWQFATVAASFACLAIGSLASYAGRVPRVQSLFLGGTTDVRRARSLVQIGLIVLLVFSTGALIYESWALHSFNLPRPTWPVTWYVHCGNDVHPYLAAVGAGALCLLLGNWLWHDAPRTGRST